MDTTSEDIIRIYASTNRKNLIVLSYPKVCLRLALIIYELEQCSVLIKTYSNPNRAIKKIKQLSFEKLFFISCRSYDNNTTAHCMTYELPKLDAFYIIDEENENDADISAVFEDLKQNLLATACCNSVSSSTESLRLERNAITIDTYHPDLVSKEKMTFLWNQLLVSVILNLARPSQEEIDKTIFRFIELHSNDALARREIINFYQSYDPADSTWWYTKTSVIYSLLNVAFRMRNVDDIFDLRFLIVDLTDHLALLYRDQIQAMRRAPILYRYLNAPQLIDFDACSRCVGGCLSFNTFFSFTEVDYKCSLGSKNDTLIEIGNLDTTNEAAMPFAHVHSLSATGDQREILFSWNSPFLVKSVKKSETSYSSIQLELLTKEKLKETLKEIARPFVGTISDPERLLTRGRELENNGETEKAIMYYKKLFNIVLFNSQDRVIEMYEQLDQLNKECE